MNYKRFIAREWLYILGFAIGGALIAGAIYLIWYPEEVEWVAFRSVTDFDRPSYYASELAAIRDSTDEPTWAAYISANLRDSLTGEFMTRMERIDSGTVTAYSVLEFARAMYDTLYDNARDNYMQTRHQNPEASEIVGAIVFIVIVVPYPLFIFFRTIRWSIKQVKQARPS